jgi:predicted aspartyl protease
MPQVTGSFDSAGNPVIKISVYGAIEQAKREFEAILDTGFTGFLSMPLLQAFPLALILYGTTSVKLADGTSHHRLTALGTLSLGNERQAGVIILEPSSTEFLLGMDFLRRFKKALVVSQRSVVLVDEDDLNGVL